MTDWIEVNLLWDLDDSLDAIYPFELFCRAELEFGENYFNNPNFLSWEESQPEYINYRKKINELDELSLATTFVGKNLNKPGVLVEFDNGQTYLIGHIVPSGYAYEAFDSELRNLTVVRYRVVWSEEK